VTDYAVDQPATSEELPEKISSGPPEPGQPGAPRGRGRVARTKRVRKAPLPPARAAVVMVLGGFSALAFWFFLYALVLSGVQEGHAQHLLYSELRYSLAQATVPFGGTIKPGTPVAYLSIPTIGLRAVVVEGTSSADLSNGPGHLPDTPFPGQDGHSQIYGRSATFGAPFGRVHDLAPGALIWVTTGQGTFGFRVLDVRLPGDPKLTESQLGPSSLTLVTSGGTGAWRNGWAPDEVIYADARLVSGQVQPAPSGRPAAVPAVDKPMAGDSNELFLTYMWLQALVAVSLALGWAYTRWNGWQLWLVGVPAIVAVLWATTSAAMLLLPNLA
jgi:sortase A